MLRLHCITRCRFQNWKEDLFTVQRLSTTIAETHTFFPIFIVFPPSIVLCDLPTQTMRPAFSY